MVATAARRARTLRAPRRPLRAARLAAAQAVGDRIGGACCGSGRAWSSSNGGALLPVDPSSTRAQAYGPCRRAGTSPGSMRGRTGGAACTRRRPTRSCVGAVDLASGYGRADDQARLNRGAGQLRCAPFPAAASAIWGARTLSGGPGVALRQRAAARHRRRAMDRTSGSSGSAFEPNDAGAVARVRLASQRAPHGPLRRRRAARRSAGRGLLRQVRRRDQPARACAGRARS